MFTKWELRVKEGGEIAAIGDQIVKLIAAEAKNQDQKIMLLKYLKEVVFDTKSGNNSNNNESDSSSTAEVSTDRRNQLLDIVHREIDRREKSNKE